MKETYGNNTFQFLPAYVTGIRDFPSLLSTLPGNKLRTRHNGLKGCETIVQRQLEIYDIYIYDQPSSSDDYPSPYTAVGIQGATDRGTRR